MQRDDRRASGEQREKQSACGLAVDVQEVVRANASRDLDDAARELSETGAPARCHVDACEAIAGHGAENVHLGLAPSSRVG